jgi:hypothetical protein
MPHAFDHRPTAQEVFDEACRFFATSPGPAVVLLDNVGGNQCRYRHGDRCCAAGHFVPDDSYTPDMDHAEFYEGDTDVNGLIKEFGARLPSWFNEHARLLRGLQRVHDNSDNWVNKHGDGWNPAGLVISLIGLAGRLGLYPTAIEQVRNRPVQS